MTQTVARVRAPELRGAGGWINTAAPLTLEQLRGRVVVLDFWTFCCINCLRVIEELRPLEHRFGNSLVVIGVHSPKFPHEAEHAAVERAVQRHRIEHPVLDDPQLETWQRYGARAWPTLVVIDQNGYIVSVAAGEGNGPALESVIAALLDGSALPEAPAYTPARVPSRDGLAFPGKVATSSDGSQMAIADTGNDRIVVATTHGAVVATHDGFSEPQGVRFDGDRLLVCCTVDGTLEAVDLRSGERTVLASGLRSPWDVVRIDDETLVVAEAGLHRLVRIPAAGGAATPFAGTGVEGLRDGPALQAHLAQPSGLAVVEPGAVAVADSEVSGLRLVRDGAIETLVGRGLFTWGDRDGDRSTARLQHPLGVSPLPGGAVAVADTFNSLLRVWHDGTLHTVALDTQLDEPGGLDTLPDGHLLVADTGNHRILVVDPATGASAEVPLDLGGRGRPNLTFRGDRGDALALTAAVELDGQDLDDTDGPPIRVQVTAEPAWLLGPGPRAWALASTPSEVEVTLGRQGEGELTIDVIAATCSGNVCTVRRSTRTHRLVVG